MLGLWRDSCIIRVELSVWLFLALGGLSHANRVINHLLLEEGDGWVNLKEGEDAR